MGTWNWTRFEENHEDGRVERQLREFGCGAAVIVMLLADRKITSDQLIVSAGLHLPSTAHEMARRLNEFSRGRHRWAGGHLDLAPPLRPEHTSALGEHGSWAALLVPHGLRDGHWVVVDGMRENDTAAVRDPVGSSYQKAAWD